MLEFRRPFGQMCEVTLAQELKGQTLPEELQPLMWRLLSRYSPCSIGNEVAVIESDYELAKKYLSGKILVNGVVCILMFEAFHSDRSQTRAGLKCVRSLYLITEETRLSYLKLTPLASLILP